MQALYFGYYLRDRRADTTHRLDLQQFISRFAQWENDQFKGQLRYNDETLFLMPFVSPVYLFCQTRDQELIKRINRRQLQAADVREILEQDESIGFASYVMFGDCWYAIASQVFSPRNAALVRFMNLIFENAQIPREFCSVAFMQQLAAAQVVRLDRVGRIAMTVRQQSPFFAQVRDYFAGGAGAEFNDVDSVDIVIKTNRRRTSNLHGLASRIANDVDRHQFDEFELRARDQLAETVSDFYVVGAGGIKDTIDGSDERRIPDIMNDAANRNRALQDRIREFRDNANFPQAIDIGVPNLPWE